MFSVSEAGLKLNEMQNSDILSLSLLISVKLVASYERAYSQVNLLQVGTADLERLQFS